jgi:hypothetical protein
VTRYSTSLIRGAGGVLRCLERPRGQMQGFKSASRKHGPESSAAPCRRSYTNRPKHHFRAVGREYRFSARDPDQLYRHRRQSGIRCHERELLAANRDEIDTKSRGSHAGAKKGGGLVATAAVNTQMLIGEGQDVTRNYREGDQPQVISDDR